MQNVGSFDTANQPNDEPGGQFASLRYATEMVAQLINLIQEADEPFDIKEIRVRCSKTIFSGDRVVVSAINFSGEPFIYCLTSENGGDPIADGY